MNKIFGTDNEIYPQLNKGFVVLGDSLDILKDMPDELVDLIITSPPYNIGKSYEVKITIEKYLAEQRQAISHLVRFFKTNGNIAWQVGNEINVGIEP